MFFTEIPNTQLENMTTKNTESFQKSDKDNMVTEYTIKTYPKFDKEFKKLSKKCPSLENDFERLKNVLLFDLKRGNHRLTQERYKQIPGLGPKVKFPVFKIRNFRCKDIPEGNKSKFRFIFILSRKHNIIYFTECYYKSQKEIENKKRIQNICSNYEIYFNN